MESLERTHDRLQKKVDNLYGSLNVHQLFPELEGIDFDFLQALLMARDLKINIRKRAIGSFFEWDKLDQAAGGSEIALGMYLRLGSHAKAELMILRYEAPSVYAQGYC